MILNWHVTMAACRAAEIDQAIQDWCSMQTVDAALATLRAADVPVGKISRCAICCKIRSFWRGICSSNISLPTARLSNYRL
jgi:hypothetical protein